MIHANEITAALNRTTAHRADEAIRVTEDRADLISFQHPDVRCVIWRAELAQNLKDIMEGMDSIKLPISHEYKSAPQIQIKNCRFAQNELERIVAALPKNPEQGHVPEPVAQYLHTVLDALEMAKGGNAGHGHDVEVFGSSAHTHDMTYPGEKRRKYIRAYVPHNDTADFAHVTFTRHAGQTLELYPGNTRHFDEKKFQLRTCDAATAFALQALKQEHGVVHVPPGAIAIVKGIHSRNPQGHCGPLPEKGKQRLSLLITERPYAHY